MIVDCFPFFNELDLLEIRLNELSDVVDVFVLSEATLTFTGKPKLLFYERNKDRFKEFHHKIHHVVVDDYSGMDVKDPRSMDRNQKQRGIDAMMRDIGPKNGDIAILSDCDEIPRAEKIKEAAEEDWEAAMIEMQLFYYFMNCKCLGRAGSWRNPRLVRPNGNVPHYNSTRKGKSDKDYWGAGWHFSFLDDIKYKIESYTHAPEFDKPPYNTDENIKDCISTGKDIFKRKRYQFEFVKDLDYLPQHILNNMGRFGKYICAT